jgi:SMODS-associated and fused to various effectors sensor domain/TIR domain
MTDPTGPCFVSYRRNRLKEVELLVGALRDRGVPVWQDIADLPHAPTEDAIRQILKDPATSAAVLFITPEVKDSPVIRKIEAPTILERALRRDSFFVVPVAGGNLSYENASVVLGDYLGLSFVPGWNIAKISDPIDAAEAGRLADAVLKERLTAIHRHRTGSEPLRLRISTRLSLDKRSGHDLVLDLTHRFRGRRASPEAWVFVIDGFRSVVRALAAHASSRPVEISGLIAVPAAVALGSCFLSLTGIRAQWIQDQQSVGRGREPWELSLNWQESGFAARMDSWDSSGSDVAILVSVTNDVRNDFRSAATAYRLPIRAVVSLAPETPPPSGRTTLNAGQAVHLANLTVDAMRAARVEYGTIGNFHLFLAGPAGLAFLIGQLLNTFGTVHTYEHVPDQSISYEPAIVLSPSSH